MESPKDISVYPPDDASILVAAGIVLAYLAAFIILGAAIFKLRRCVRRRQKRKQRKVSQNYESMNQPPGHGRSITPTTVHVHGTTNAASAS